MKINFFETLKKRGLVQDHTPDIQDFMNIKSRVAYSGFDPTASSLHIGHLAVVMLSVHLQQAGHKPLLLVGGATGMIGDPSGKSSERNLLTLETILQNTAAIKSQLVNFLDFSSGSCQAEIVNNYDWYKHFGLLEFLREIGKQLTVNYMMAKDSVQKRLETGLSFTEFSYQLLQAYDYYYLHKTKQCQLQLGGSDQWGNITAGIELVRRISNEHVHGLTTPLLTKADGSKFGKTESGNIWLDPTLTSPYKFYQFWLNVGDEDINRMYRVFSLKPIEEIDAILAAHSGQKELRAAQSTLAAELTERIHGLAAVKKAQAVSAVLFGNATVDALTDFSHAEIEEIFEGVPGCTLPMSAIEAGISALDLMTQSQVAPSKSEAKRLITGGGIKINKFKVNDVSEMVTTNALINNRFLLLQSGKKNYYLLRFE